jgi:hypothetical protein
VPRIWLGWRRPLLFTFVLGCAWSLTSAGELNLPLALSTAAAWSLLPAIQVAALLGVMRLYRLREPVAGAVDRFFAGFAVWGLWLAGLCIVFAFAPSANVYPAYRVWLVCGGLSAAAWSAYVDYGFFRQIPGCAPRRARRCLIVHRLASWIPIAVVISGAEIVELVRAVFAW